LALNRERAAERHAEWRATHRPQLAAQLARYRAKHKSQHAAYQSAYYVRYKTQVAAKHAAWRAMNPEQRATLNAAYRARRFGNGGSHTLAEWREKLELFAHCCAYCGESKPLTRDHNIPLSRGGTDDIMNILPACQSCNSRKHRLTALEFIGARKAA